MWLLLHPDQEYGVTALVERLGVPLSTLHREVVRLDQAGLRPAIVRFCGEFGPYPLAHARPFLDVEGRELVRVVQEQVHLERRLQLVIVRNGQLVLADTAERFRSAVDYDDGVAGRAREAAPPQWAR